MTNRTRLLMLILNCQVQLETVRRGDLRHCRPRRLRPGREGGGAHHEGGEEYQVSRECRPILIKSVNKARSEKHCGLL